MMPYRYPLYNYNSLFVLNLSLYRIYLTIYRGRARTASAPCPTQKGNHTELQAFRASCMQVYYECCFGLIDVHTVNTGRQLGSMQLSRAPRCLSPAEHEAVPLSSR